MTKIIALVDANNFYASCERVFNPAYIGEPIVILSNHDGCVISRSNEAKALGIPMGAPYFKFKDICKQHHIIIHSSNFELYGNMSTRIMKILAASAPKVEIYSIDEAFLDLTGIDDPYTFCLNLTKTILTWTGIPVSIGISSTKTLAKVAGNIAKETETGVYHLSSCLPINDILQNLPIKDVWGIGRKWAIKLETAFNIKTAYDLKNADIRIIRKHFSVIGERIMRELDGLSCLNFEDIKDKKSIASTRSFGRAISDLEELKEAIAMYTSKAARKLRKQKSKSKGIYVFIKTDRFKSLPQYINGKAISLTYPTSDTSILIKAAIGALENIYKNNYLYKKAGIVLFNITPESYVQRDILSIYNQKKTDQSASLMQAIDEVNSKLGRNALKYAVEGCKQEWKSRSELLSRRYTNCWSELMEVV